MGPIIATIVIIRNPQNSIGNHQGPYTRAQGVCGLPSSGPLNATTAACETSGFLAPAKPET